MMPSAEPIRDEAASPPSEAERLIETLSGRLLTGDSATAVLEAWCEERGLARAPRLVARRVDGPVRPPNLVQAQRLSLEPGEPVRYRRVRLSCGIHVLSEAENWYVPGRLTPEMNRLLDVTEAPFGRVIHPLAPTRHNLRLVRLWPPGTDRVPAVSDPLFSIQAVLSDRDGRPICEVGEIYTGAILAGGHP